jgi:hypothetical protein
MSVDMNRLRTLANLHSQAAAVADAILDMQLEAVDQAMVAAYAAEGVELDPRLVGGNGTIPGQAEVPVAGAPPIDAAVIENAEILRHLLLTVNTYGTAGIMRSEDGAYGVMRPEEVLILERNHLKRTMATVLAPILRDGDATRRLGASEMIVAIFGPGGADEIVTLARDL